MKSIYGASVALGALMILFAVFCPAVIAQVHPLAWRTVIALLGCFLLISGVYRMVHKR